VIADGWINLPTFAPEDLDAAPKLARLAEFFGGSEHVLSRTVDELLGGMAAAGIDRGLLASRMHSASGNDPWSGFFPAIETALEIQERHPDKLRCSLLLDDLSSIRDVCHRIRDYASHVGVCDVRAVPALLRTALNHRTLYPVYQTCEELGIPMTLNVGIVGPRVSSEPQLPILLEDVLLDFPDLTVVAAHGGHPWERLLIRLMMKFEKLFLMTSAYSPRYLDPELVAFMNSSRGRHKVIFATDWPVLDFERTVREAMALPLSDEARDRYMSGNLLDVVSW
jgi:predicted TIM-barrel fold metal-dependent hydrolase